MCISTHTTKNSWHKDVKDRQMYTCVWYFCTYSYGLSLNRWHALLCIANNRHGVIITAHAIKRHLIIWMTTLRQPSKRWCSCVLTWKYTFICVYWWTRHRIHNTLIVVDRHLRRMGDKTIPDEAIDLPHHSVVDSFMLHRWFVIRGTRGAEPGIFVTAFSVMSLRYTDTAFSGMNPGYSDTASSVINPGDLLTTVKLGLECNRGEARDWAMPTFNSCHGNRVPSVMVEMQSIMVGGATWTSWIG